MSVLGTSSAETSIPNVLRARALRQPDAPAYTFVDYEIDPAGFPETLTWSQVYQRVRVVAEELTLCGAIGDRAAILAPQGLEYVIAFLGALHAGFVAVPLSVPQAGSHDERVSAALRDSAPTVILTTTAVADVVREYSAALGRSAPSVVEVDALDLDAPVESEPAPQVRSRPAYLQYTSGSTRVPAGVMVSHRNVVANLEQVMADYFAETGGVPPVGTTVVSWLPFFHDMGLIHGVCAPIHAGLHAVLMSPMAFLQRPARWIQQLASHTHTFSAAPNFAFELAVRRTSDDDLAGLNLSDVSGIISGSERIHAATITRFNERFEKFGLRRTTVRPSYGLAEATVYVATAELERIGTSVRFEYEKLSAGHAKRCENTASGGTELVSYGAARTSTLRIVDPETMRENPAGAIGEIWVHGENVAMGYWRNPEQTARYFGISLVSPTPSTPADGWLRTGDLGVMSDGELFIIGRIKDLLIVDGRNHYPDDIEATIQEITGGRVAAIAIPDDRTEHLVAIIELKDRTESREAAIDRLRGVKRQVTSAISQNHSLWVADIVLVPQGAIPITTSGKVRRSTCLDRYRLDDFSRLDASM
ncbi:AMP-binding protein [Mycobacterium antarcticum]|uniref:AMP-binding protein n=1 Tax=Mycolicibacterium sp. TUM20984 TaxID=3023368 RepID=UPI0023A61045|nr:AMP-binding protein [Mycolicibacterium sp. TUM20984]GLP81764.1 long-chain-fatty-acid--AMP ligase FadD26 [Mycolicibacterium sp. TUM20984]